MPSTGEIQVPSRSQGGGTRLEVGEGVMVGVDVGDGVSVGVRVNVAEGRIVTVAVAIRVSVRAGVSVC